MAEGAISKKQASETRIVEETEQLYSGAGVDIAGELMGYLEWGRHSSALQSHAIRTLEHALGHFLAQKESEKPSQREWAWLDWATLLEFYSTQYLPGNAVEKRLAQLERVTSAQRSTLGRLEARIGLLATEDQEEQEEWPAFACEEFEKIFENRKGLEDAGEDKSLVLYHIMEIETLLGRVERKARATDREYEARLAASLRDICRIHEPAELSNEQIECLAGSLQALVEGWGALNRKKVKWIRGRLLEVGLTWLPVTEKAKSVIDEARSSVK